MLHSEILPEHDCGGELIELPEDEPTYVVYPGMRTRMTGVSYEQTTKSRIQGLLERHRVQE